MKRAALKAFLERLVRVYTQAHVPFFAASLAYYALFSLLPLLLLIVGVFGLMLESRPDLEQAFMLQIEHLAQNLFPASATVGASVTEALRKGAASATLTSVLILGWTASNFFAALSYALSLIFGGRGPGWRGRLLGLAAPLLLGLGLLLFSLASLALAVVLPYLPDGPWRGFVVGSLPWLATLLAFFVIYRFLPYPPPGALSALGAAFLASSVWTALSRLLPGLISRTRYESVYGPLAGFLLALFGFYLAMWILLGGAAVLRAFFPDEAEAL
ncbi:MAG TPA: YihY/virulence factor BrkB family protein [Oceanithermus profundus]|uniref:YihY/virulence factor BrkB family protein n=2 Tax=Oceanithermus profundus TaxID=187137 RepID=A0A7C4ZG36_9DEIN|nr:YihY/virulence factor BrkB family protein [Oceanithermus profundus]